MSRQWCRFLEDATINPMTKKLALVALLFFLGFTFFFKAKSSTAQSLKVFVSSEYGDNWKKENLIDGDPRTCWSSSVHNDSDREEWAGIDLRGIKVVDQISVEFRSTSNSNVNNVPEHFVLQYTTADDEQWTDIPVHRYTDVYPENTRDIPYPEDKTDNNFSLEPLYARKIRIKAEKLRQDDVGNYALQICEMGVKESVQDIQRFYTSLGGQLDADLNNFYNIFSLGKNQKNYVCGYEAAGDVWGPGIGARAVWSCGISGESGYWVTRKFAWDNSSYNSFLVQPTTYQKWILGNYLGLPVTEDSKDDQGNWILPPASRNQMPEPDEGGIVWSTDTHPGHLGRDYQWLTENNAHYLLSLWEYLRWSGDKDSLTQIGDRVLRVKKTDGSWRIYNEQSDYIHRIGVFHHIGQDFETAEPIKEINLGIYGIDQSHNRSHFKIIVTQAGQLVAEQTYNGIDDCSLGKCWDRKGWVSISKSDGTDFGPGSYYVRLENLGDPTSNPLTHLDYYKSPVGWLSSFKNKFGPVDSHTAQVATVNGVARTPLENARIAMNYQLNEMHGKEGILILDKDNYFGEYHQGNRENGQGKEGYNRPSAWFDVPRFGYKNSWLNVFYYGSLQAMANIEEMIGDTSKSGYLKNEVMPKVKQSFNREFWNSQTGRYVSNIGTNGEKLDFGHTPINLMAIYWGLADESKTNSIMSWLNGDRIIPGDTSTGADIYHFQYASRANTKDLKSTGSPYWWVMGFDPGGHRGKKLNPSDPATWGWDVQPDGSGKADFGNWEQNGGAFVSWSFEDVTNRASYISSDNSWQRFKAIVNNYHRDGFYREPWRCWTDGYHTGLLSCPSNGIAGVTFIESFLGVSTKPDGLHIKPNLPSELNFAGVRNLVHWGDTYSIKVDRSVNSPQIKTVGENEYEIIVPVNADLILGHGQVVSYDLNNDGQINSQDLKILLENWGDSPSEPRADLNGDGQVNGIDFGRLRKLVD